MATPRRVDLVDLSHYQPGTIAWRKAKAAGLRGVLHKATEGDAVTDLMYPIRRAQAARAGLPFGGYHFARPALGNAQAQAEHFLKTATPKRGTDLGAALDLEATGGLTPDQLDTWAVAWGTVVKVATGGPILLYIGAGLPPLPRASKFFDFVWRPRYNNANTPPAAPWDLWQFSNGVYGVPNRLPGLPFPADLDTLRDGLSIEELLIPLSGPPVPPAPAPAGYQPSRGMIDAIARATDLEHRRVDIGVGNCGRQVRITAGATRSLGATALEKMRHVELHPAKLWRHIPNGSIVWGGPGFSGCGHVGYKDLGSGPGHFDGQFLTPGSPLDPNHWVRVPNWNAIRTGRHAWSADKLIGWSPDIDGVRP